MESETPRTLIRSLTSRATKSTTTSQTAKAKNVRRRSTRSAKKTPAPSSTTKRKQPGRSASKVVKETPRALIRQLTSQKGGLDTSTLPTVVATPQSLTPAPSIQSTPASLAATPLLLSASSSANVSLNPTPSSANFSRGVTPLSANASLNTTSVSVLSSSANASLLETPGSLPRGALSHRKALKTKTTKATMSTTTTKTMPPPAKRKSSKTTTAAASLLPATLVAGLFQSFVSKKNVSTSAKKVAQTCLNEFLPQMVDDLQIYALHAGRQTIEASDVLLLMQRQRLTNVGENSLSAMDLARKHLPMEALEELLPVAVAFNGIVPPTATRQSKKAKIPDGDDEEEDDDDEEEHEEQDQ